MIERQSRMDWMRLRAMKDKDIDTPDITCPLLFAGYGFPNELLPSGFNCAYTRIIPGTVLKGALIITRGSVIIDGIVVQ